MSLSNLPGNYHREIWQQRVVFLINLGLNLENALEQITDIDSEYIHNFSLQHKNRWFSLILILAPSSYYQSSGSNVLQTCGNGKGEIYTVIFS